MPKICISVVSLDTKKTLESKRSEKSHLTDDLNQQLRGTLYDEAEASIGQALYFQIQ